MADQLCTAPRVAISDDGDGDEPRFHRRVAQCRSVLGYLRSSSSNPPFHLATAKILRPALHAAFTCPFLLFSAALKGNVHLTLNISRDAGNTCQRLRTFSFDSALQTSSTTTNGCILTVPHFNPVKRFDFATNLLNVPLAAYLQFSTLHTEATNSHTSAPPQTVTFVLSKNHPRHATITTPLSVREERTVNCATRSALQPYSTALHQTGTTIFNGSHPPSSMLISTQPPAADDTTTNKPPPRPAPKPYPTGPHQS